VVPIYFAFNGQHIYGLTTLGQKTEWMRANENVCLEIDQRVSFDNWMSVIVFGRYEELPDEPEYEAARIKALALLQSRAMWWQPAFAASSHRGSPETITPIFYRIHIEKMTGHRAIPDEAETTETGSKSVTKGSDWWHNIRRRLHLI
jgi:nitroimidazol reductase NimA-like FMN-containing flavoprotein (pyridoxamine 5'-phosphate oxidase superfamily)